MPDPIVPTQMVKSWLITVPPSHMVAPSAAPEALAASRLVHAWAAVHPSIAHGQRVRALRLSA